MIGTTAINRIIVLILAAAVFILAASPDCTKIPVNKTSSPKMSANYKPGLPQRVIVGELLSSKENIDIKKIFFSKYHINVVTVGADSAYGTWAVLFAFFYSGIVFLLRRFNYIIVSIGKKTSILALSIGGNSPPIS